ncbi:YIP1 family protein [Desulfovibrio sp.]
MSTAFDFQRLWDDSLAILRDPKRFFSSMPASGGFGDPVLRAVVYGLAAGVMNLLWGLFGMGHGRMMTSFGGLGIGGLAGMPLVALAGLFVGGGLLWLAARLCGARPGYEAAARASAVCQVLLPVRAAFNVFHAASPSLGLAMSVALNLFGAWLAYHALGSALGVEERKARVAGVVLAVLSLAGMAS